MTLDEAINLEEATSKKEKERGFKENSYWNYQKRILNFHN